MNVLVKLIDFLYVNLYKNVKMAYFVKFREIIQSNWQWHFI